MWLVDGRGLRWLYHLNKVLSSQHSTLVQISSVGIPFLGVHRYPAVQRAPLPSAGDLFS